MIYCSHEVIQKTKKTLKLSLKLTSHSQEDYCKNFDRCEISHDIKNNDVCIYAKQKHAQCDTYMYSCTRALKLCNK